MLEKAKLIDGADGPQTFRPSMMQGNEESKGLLQNESEALERSKTPTSPLLGSAGSRDLTPDRMRRNKTGITLFKKEQDG